MTVSPIVIVDYGVGNLRSLQNAFEELGVNHSIATTPEEVEGAEKLLLPGVGSFIGAMENLEGRQLGDVVVAHAKAGKPLLGICLGMQLLCEGSSEHGDHKGLGLIPLTVERLPNAADIRVPHVGWNSLSLLREDPLLEGVPDGSDVYFVHSYAVMPAEDSYSLAATDHGVRFASVIRSGCVFGAQFHPEKSQRSGLRILQNFAAL